MASVSLSYLLDLGACGAREVRVNAEVLTDLTGKLYLDIAEVLVNIHGRDCDLLPFIGERDRSAMREGLRHVYWSEMSARVRDASEVGA